MEIIKLNIIGCLTAFIVITILMSSSVIAGGLIDMGYGSRGESMLGGGKVSRSK